MPNWPHGYRIDYRIIFFVVQILIKTLHATVFMISVHGCPIEKS